MDEIEYLKKLCDKFGSHYLGKYFGFTLKEIAEKLGISRNHFTSILTGKRKFEEKYKDSLSNIFKEMDIVNRTKDFKETPSDLMTKEIIQAIRNEKR